MRYILFLLICVVFGVSAGIGGAVSLMQYRDTGYAGWLIVFVGWLLAVALVGGTLCGMAFKRRADI
jgi:hypothetical protein